MTAPQKKTALDYNKLAEDYSQHRRVHPQVLQELLQNIANNTRVLEVGCGTGNYIEAIQTACSCLCTGIDPSPAMLAHAARHSQVKYQLGQAEQLAFSDATFDLVYSVDVIHHVVNRPAYFREALRILAAGGHFCTVTDSAEIIRQRQPLSRFFPETVPVELARYPDIADLRRLLAESGFTGIQEKLVEFAYAVTDSAPYRQRAYSSLHLISEAAWQTGLERLEKALAQGTVPGVSRYVLLWGTKPNQAELLSGR